MVMTDTQYRAFLDLLMCSDPWPIEGEGGEHMEKILVSFANEEAKRHGFDNWIIAFHELRV